MYTLQPETKNKRVSWPTLMLATGLGLFIVGMAFMLIGAFALTSWFIVLDTVRIRNMEPPDRLDACDAAPIFVNHHQYIGDAIFPEWTEENCRTTLIDDRWTVVSFYDIRDEAGVMKRHEYVVELVFDFHDNIWTGRVISIDGNPVSFPPVRQ